MTFRQFLKASSKILLVFRIAINLWSSRLRKHSPKLSTKKGTLDLPWPTPSAFVPFCYRCCLVSAWDNLFYFSSRLDIAISVVDIRRYITAGSQINSVNYSFEQHDAIFRIVVFHFSGGLFADDYFLSFVYHSRDVTQTSICRPFATVSMVALGLLVKHRKLFVGK